MPACGPPSSLSPENVTSVMPSDKASRTVRSCGNPYVSRSTSAPLPRSSTTGTPARRPRRDEFVAANVRGEALDPVVRRMGAQQQRRVAARVRLRSHARRRDWWCRLRAAPRRCVASTSGRRKPPPISTSWPRATTTSRPFANVSSTSSTAAAQLLTISAVVGARRSRIRDRRRDRSATRAVRRRDRTRDSSTLRNAVRLRPALRAPAERGPDSCAR